MVKDSRAYVRIDKARMAPTMGKARLGLVLATIAK